MGKVIAIDGPSGSGKSTISKLIAERLGFTYLDTGALYRTVALKLRRRSLSEDSPDSVIEEVLNKTSLSLRDGFLFLDGEKIGDEIRTTEIGRYSSVFSARKVVRDSLLNIQRDAAADNDIVAEGRDVTTVVFPDAYRKFYLSASEEERAKRRYLQLKRKGISITVEDALRDVKERDERDSQRDISPLKKAEDAVLIDTTDLPIDETVERIMRYINDADVPTGRRRDG